MKMKILTRALFTGSAASLISSAAIAVCSKIEAGAYARGANATSHWIWNERAHRQQKPSWRYTATGLAIHQASSIFWGVLFETLLQQRLQKRGIKPLATAHVSTPIAPPPPQQQHLQQQPEVGGVKRLGKIYGTAALVSTLANIVDFKLTPKRLMPGFERHLSRPSLAMVYTAFGLGLAGAVQWRELRKQEFDNRNETNRRISNQFDYDVIHY